MLGESTVQPDVERAAQMAPGERFGGADVEYHGATGLIREHLIQRQAGQLFVCEQPVRMPVEPGHMGRVAGPGRLPFGDRPDDLINCSKPQRVIGPTLLAGYICLASSSETEPAMITSSPGRQLTGVETLCRAVSCSESMTRSTLSKLRPVVIG